MKTLYPRNWKQVITIVVVFLLFSGGLYAQTPQYLQVSGIANPAAANGIFIKQSGTTGYDPDWEYWKHESANFYIYARKYVSGDEYFWNINATMANTDINDLNALFFSDGVHDAAFLTSLTSPDQVSNWGPETGTETAGGCKVEEYTPFSAPTVTTTVASSIANISATLGGNVTADGGATVTERGIVYSTSDATPTVAEGATKVSMGSGTGSFSQSVGSLAQGTIYYYKAYAINSSGTSYGESRSFTTLAPPTITSVSPSSGPASGGTSVVITGTNLLSAIAVKFGSTNATGFTVNSATQIIATSPAGAAGTVDITVTTAVGTSATSTADQYTYLVAPTVTTQAVSNIAATAATGNGTVTATGGANITERGIYYSTTNGFADGAGTKVSTTGDWSVPGSFTQAITGLTAGTTYYVKAFAKNSAETGYGSQVSFTTPAIVTSVSVPYNGNYKSGDILDFKVKYNAAVTVDITNGRPYIPITLNTGGTVKAIYAYYWDYDKSHYFRYQIVNGNFDADGIAVGTAITANGGTLKGPDGVDANLTLYKVASTTGVWIDAIAPWVSSVSSTTANGTYKTGDNIVITLTFSEPVTITGTPSLILNSGGIAYYISGTGTSELTFKYTVGSGQGSSDLDYSSASGSFQLSNGTIKDAAGNSTSLILPTVGGPNSLGGQKDIVIEIAPTVSTQEVSSISIITATGNGNLTSLGIPNPTAYGICWNTTGTPTTANSKVDNGAASSSGAFTASMTGLSANTTYYVRAFATNSAGTSYGSEVSFTTYPIPTLTESAGGTSIAQNSPVYIASDANVSGKTLEGALVFINDNSDPGQDVLGIDGVQSGTDGSISWSYDSSKGILTLSGKADVATYQTILRKVTYTNTSPAPSTSPRSITVSLNNALPFSGNGHFYEFVASSGITWTSAKTAAEARDYFGVKGYLATITSAEENAFCTSKLSGNVWMGATDAADEGSWIWATGPEAGTILTYSNWDSGQPDNHLGIEDYAQFTSQGKWNDLPDNPIGGYMVEYGGSAGDPTLDISDVVTVDFSVPVTTAATSIQSNSFAANWNTVSGATNYYLDVATNSSFTEFVSGYDNKVVGNVTTYKVEGLNPITTYYYRVRATSSGYNSNVNSATTIKADQTITFNSLPEKTYGDSDFSPAATASSGLTVIYTSSDTNVATIVGGMIHIVGAGTCTIYADESGDDTYNAAAQASQQLTVTQRAITVTADAGQAKVYGEADPLPFTYSVTEGSLVTGDAFTGVLHRATGEIFGSYEISKGTLTIVEGETNKEANYAVTYVPEAFTISQRAITVTADDKSKVYGQDDPALTYQITAGTLAYTDAFTGTLTRDAGEDVNTYAITQGSLALSTNYNLSFVSGELDITQRAITVTADDKSKVYGEDDPALTYRITAGTLAFSDAFTGALTRDTGEDVDTYAITQGTLAVSSNYTLSFVSGELDITRRAITVTADDKSKVYGEDDPALTYRITAGTLAYTDAFTGAMTRDAGEDVDTYAITQGTLGLSANYNLGFVQGELYITRRAITVTADDKTKIYGDADPALTYQITSGSLAYTDAFTGALTREAGEDVDTYAITQGSLALSTNYNLSFVSGELDITQRAITVAADDKTKVYGDADPALTYRITAGTLAYTDEFTGALTRDAGEDVGTYAITQGTLALSTNYNLNFVDGELDITRRAITVTADDKSKVYGKDDPALTYQITSGSLAYTDEFTGALTRDAGEDVDTYAITQGTLALSINYNLGFVQGELDITRRAITVTVDDKTKVYGDSDPALTYQITAGTLAFSDAFTGALTRDAGEDVDTYAITQGSLGLSANYNLSFVQGELDITQRAIAVTADDKSKVYGQDDPALTYQITSGSLAYTEEFTGALTREAGEDVDTYAITQGTLALSSNYNLGFVSGELDITQRAITVTADNKSKVYGEDDPALSYRITAGTLAYTDAFTGALTRDTGEDVDAYAITQGTLALSSNYNLSFVPGELDITRREITVTADDKSKVYGDADPALTYQIAAGTLAFSDAFTGALTRDAGEDVGTYAVTKGSLTISDLVSGGRDNNYHFSFQEGALTIMKAQATIQLLDLEQAYTGKPLEVSYQTSPAGLQVNFKYDDISMLPSELGEYVVTAVIADKNHEGSATGIFRILEDKDGDGIPDLYDTDADNDGVSDEEDMFPNDPNEWADFDGDGIGDNADVDEDNDGTPDVDDAFPFDPNEDTDSDGDGVGDNSDLFPLDPEQWDDTMDPELDVTQLTPLTLVCGIDFEDQLKAWLDTQAGVVATDNHQLGAWSHDLDIEEILSNLCNESKTIPVEFTVTDFSGNSGSFTTTLVVVVNAAPTVITPLEDVVMAVNATHRIYTRPLPGEMFGDDQDQALEVRYYALGSDTLPSWAMVVNDTLVFSPAIADTGCYQLVVEATDMWQASVTDTFQVCIRATLVHTDPLASNGHGIIVYPNPASDFVRIKPGNQPETPVEVTLMNLSGQAVLHRQFWSDEPLEIDLTGQKTGMYVIRITFNNQTMYNKLMIERR